jgi:hypothetical protein
MPEGQTWSAKERRISLPPSNLAQLPRKDLMRLPEDAQTGEDAEGVGAVGFAAWFAG